MESICARDTFFFHNQVLTESGIYYDTLQALTGCDSIIELTLMVNPIYYISVLETICAGDTFLFHDRLLTETGIYSDTLPTMTGCDSIVELQLFVDQVFRDTLEVATCINQLPYNWRDEEYFATGIYYDSLTSSLTGCDSIYVLNLTVNPSTAGEITITTLENNTPYLINDEYYDSTGVYTQHLTNVANCDSVLTIHLTVLYNVQSAIDSTICDSLLPFTWDGMVFTEAGIQDTIYQSVSGSDSVVAMTLYVKASSDSTITDTIVENNLPYTLNGVEYDTIGTYVQHLSNAVGCDSTLTLSLQVLYNVHNNKYATICLNHLPATWEGHVWTAAGTVIDTFLRADGTDSLVVKTLTVGMPTDTTIYDTLVENNLPYILNDSIYHETGDYQQVLTNKAGCDSTITLHLTVFYNEQTTLDSTICDDLLPFLWNEITFTSAGTKDTLLHTTHGADSLVTMTLTVNETTSSTITATILENDLPYMLNGIAYDSTDIYTQSFTNANNCDSTVTLDLTVFYNVETEMDSVICSDSLPLVWNGVTFTEEGTQNLVLHSVTGADSTLVMHLTVHNSTTEFIELFIPENNTPYLLNGQYLDTTGVYIQHLTNVVGCDSTLTISFTKLFNVTAEADSTVCENVLPFTWNGVTFTGNGSQTIVIQRPDGTDSILTMNVLTKPAPNAQISGPPVLCADNFATLTANDATSYLWSTGDTTQSIQVYSLATYSVTVSNEYNCTDNTSLTLNESVIVNPIESIQFPDMCAGNVYSITVGHESSSTVVLENPVSSLSWADTVFLPDGVYCAPYGCSYQSPLTFTDFASGSTVSSVNDILYVRLNMEHSYAGDLYINITCPNGQKADILRFKGNSSYFQGQCMSEIPMTSRNWQAGSNASGSTFFGMAYDHSSSLNNACNSNNSSNAPGIGWNYCWSNNNDQGYIYAPGQGSLVYRSVNAHQHTNAYYNPANPWSGEEHYVDIFDSSNVAAGTQFYHPDQSFASLIGCPLNGSWTIEVIDGIQEDNGYLFGWELALAPYLVPSEFSDVTIVTVDGPWVTVVSDSAFIFSPPADLPNDTVVEYTFHLEDMYGCGYDTVVSLNVYAQSRTIFDTTVCGSFLWNEVTYTESQQIVLNDVNIHGCDSVTEITLTVNPIPMTVVSGLPVPCVDDTSHLAAVCADTTATFLWSTGDTTQTLTVEESGEYAVTVTNSKGCSYDTAVNVLFTSNSYSVIDTMVCDNFFWNGVNYTQSGQYDLTFVNSEGCDSVVTLDLTVNHSTTTHDTLTLLQNQLPYYFAPHDTTFNADSPAEFQFSYTLLTQDECDSIVLQKVYVYYNTSQSFDTTVCAEAVPLLWHGHTFTCTATITDTFLSVHGSDSVMIYSVFVDTINVTIGNVNHVLCFGDNTGSASATVTGSVGSIQYQWTTPNGTLVSNTNAINGKPAGTYNLSVSDETGCVTTSSVTINTTHGAMSPGEISGSENLCHGDTIEIVMGTAAVGDAECSYQWQVSYNGTEWGPAPSPNNTQNYVFNEGTFQAFHLRRAWISASCGTQYSDTLSFVVWPTFRDTIYDDICLNQVYQENGFNISDTETGEAGTLTSIKYYDTQHGCDSVIVLMLTIHEPQDTTLAVEICEGDGYYGSGFSISAQETIGKDTLQRTLNLFSVNQCDSVVQLNVSIIDTALRIICESMSAELVVETEMTDYVWSTGEQMPNITVVLPGTYSVTATQGGCRVTARYLIESCDLGIYLPNAISPSREDGLNDVFRIPEMTQRMINDFEISVFNRWGELIYYSTDKNFSWNGEVKGNIFYNSVYNYIIRYTDANGKPYFVKGSITVL